ncbi:snRNA-activating protein complex subunit 4-like [Maniola hyperantus]|uniref:snRNA-activating protein complex subunit 4-like n=1 Tax=Aphantopus hyperantus TaxID=2795564 RepID=UPI001567DB73|nr:snRNA-activating protein complex subunit 4-like [Maniola hyperantus]
MSDLDESEFDSDEESELQDLEKINIAIAELDNEEPKPGTSASVSHGASTSVASICSVTSSHGEYSKLSKVETALALNRMLDEKLRKLEALLQSRLLECCRRLAKVNVVCKPNRSGRTKFSYGIFGKPYFKDSRGFPAPDNEDTILMKESQMYDFSNIASAVEWTVKDKCHLTMLIHKLSKDMKKKRLNSQTLALQREDKNMKTTKNNKIISELKREIANVNKEPLKTLALLIDEEYDWDYIANKMQNRHSPNEYRALWKLFLHPSINKSVWTKSEHLSLQKIAFEKEFQDWDAIAQELGTGRTNYQCFVYFRTNINNTFTSRKWTREEEKYLLRLIDYYREENYIPWGKVAASMENRTKVQVYNKYARLSEERKGRFLPEEDSVILTCVNKFGQNFRKITEYLQGRSVTQCRDRHHVLTKREYSAVWTVGEDQKLVRLMANQDASTNFSTLAQYFPGKNRVHIRTRYLILRRWMRRNPNVDVKYAPRRGPRRLEHGKSTDDLNRAIENLKKRLEAEVIDKKKSMITKDSPEEVIDDAIVALVAKENTRKMEAQNLLLEEQGTEVVSGGETRNCDITVLRNILILLKAKLNKQKFKNSPFRNTYSGLLDSEPGSSTIQVRSYSKKNAVKNIQMAKVDIWGNALKGQLSYLLPPHYATITGCKQLILHYINSETDSQESKHMNVLIRKNMMFREQIDLLMERFNSLFLWPMHLSNVSPEDCKITNAENNIVPSPSKPAKKLIIFQKEDYDIALPQNTKLRKIEKIDSEDIDLKESEDTHKIEIDESYFDFIP